MRAAKSAGLALAAVAAAAAVSACSERKAEHSGVGRWTFSSSTLAHGKSEGRCQPTDLSDGRKAMWCFGVPPFKIGGRLTEIHLYFGGVTDDAKLIEIQLQTRGCVEEEVDRWMRSNFGPPLETRAKRGYWKNSFLWAAALMPSEPGRCIVHLLPLSEGSEIERIKLK